MNKYAVKRLIPGFVWRGTKWCLFKMMAFSANALGYNYALREDFSNPLPWQDHLRRHRDRWDRPSRLPGLKVDLEALKARLTQLMERYGGELAALPPYEEMRQKAGGWGCPRIDVLTLYLMIRDLKPRRYLEVGSGLTTAYVRLAAARNAAEGRSLAMTCVEPYPSAALQTAADIQLNSSEVQNLDPGFFDCLEAGDVLFIDSSHVLKIDSDVTFLYLEVLPRLKAGVWVHIHDIPLPYNTPFPADTWVLPRNPKQPPMYWTEAMVVQAFLACNDCFQIELSTPFIRFHDEPFLRARMPGYQGIDEQPDAFSSLWLRRVR